MVHFGLIGARLGHSLSPQIHQLIFKELGVEGTYDLLEIPPEELYASVHELRGKYCGVNVTIPHKINVMAALTTLSMEAQAIGAVIRSIFITVQFAAIIPIMQVLGVCWKITASKYRAKARLF